MTPEWRTLVDFPDYEVSEDGRVFSKYNKRLLRPRKNSRGYMQVVLMRDGVRHSKCVHLLVLNAFKGVAHTASPHTLRINHNKADNSVGNFTIPERTKK